MAKTVAAGQRAVRPARNRERGIHVSQRRVDSAQTPPRAGEVYEAPGAGVRSIALRVVRVPFRVVTRETLLQMLHAFGETPHHQ